MGFSSVQSVLRALLPGSEAQLHPSPRVWFHIGHHFATVYSFFPSDEFFQGRFCSRPCGRSFQYECRAVLSCILELLLYSFAWGGPAYNLFAIIGRIPSSVFLSLFLVLSYSRPFSVCIVRCPLPFPPGAPCSFANILRVDSDSSGPCYL